MEVIKADSLKPESCKSGFFIRLKQLRENANLKQNDLVDVLQVTIQSISAYENGREPNYETLSKLANFYHVTTDYLITGKEKDTPTKYASGDWQRLSDTEADLVETRADNKRLQEQIERLQQGLKLSQEAFEGCDREMRKFVESCDEFQKAFVLACRYISDEFVCPAEAEGSHFPECNGEMEACGDDGMWECWQRYFKERVKSEAVCRVCGCTEKNACPGGCSWVEDDLCSSCSGEPTEAAP